MDSYDVTPVGPEILPPVSAAKQQIRELIYSCLTASKDPSEIIQGTQTATVKQTGGQNTNIMIQNIIGHQVTNNLVKMLSILDAMDPNQVAGPPVEIGDLKAKTIEFQYRIVRAALERSGYHQDLAAELLNVTPKTIRNKIRAYQKLEETPCPHGLTYRS